MRFIILTALILFTLTANGFASSDPLEEDHT